MATLEDRKLRALDLIPNPHLIAPTIDETFVDSTVAKNRVQTNWNHQIALPC